MYLVIHFVWRERWPNIRIRLTDSRKWLHWLVLGLEGTELEGNLGKRAYGSEDLCIARYCLLESNHCGRGTKQPDG